MRDYPLADAAKRITHGKTTSCGQICVSPDYALVPRESAGDFVTAVRSCFLRMFGSDFNDSPDYSWVVNDRHCARVSELLADAREMGATVVPCADYDASRNGRQMPLHIVTDCTSEMRIMNEELFGPILPVVPYDSFDDVVRIVNAGDRPLAMYCFSHDAARMLLSAAPRFRPHV